ncbi:MAG TPA: hypothetical protein VEF76_14225 [Patescibacteria group bacterium]|nr:hypothetical protein [Patescibacteria group bacterium]
MSSNTAREPLLKFLTRTEVVLPFATSLAISGPCTFASLSLMHKYTPINEPGLWVTAVLGLAGLNLAAIITLEADGERLGRLTLPALLAAVGVVMLFVLAQVVNRFALPVGYSWLLPFVVGALAFCYCGVFRERALFLKAYLALNGLAVTVLWCLATADKLSLPF